VCFPQFGGFGPLAQHGFVRNSEFTLVDGGSTSVKLSLQTTEEHLKLFPHPFELSVTVRPLNSDWQQPSGLQYTCSRSAFCRIELHGRH